MTRRMTSRKLHPYLVRLGLSVCQGRKCIYVVNIQLERRRSSIVKGVWWGLASCDAVQGMPTEVCVLLLAQAFYDLSIYICPSDANWFHNKIQSEAWPPIESVFDKWRPPCWCEWPPDDRPFNIDPGTFTPPHRWNETIRKIPLIHKWQAWHKLRQLFCGCFITSEPGKKFPTSFPAKDSSNYFKYFL